ncbi:C-X-C motif chemokine 11-1-like [Aplochiton taeniatus]
MTPAVLLTLLCLMVLHGEGQRLAGFSCVCLDPGVERLRPNLVKKYVMYPASNSCPRVEIIAFLKNGERKCLNLKSKLSQHYIAKANERLEAKKNQANPSPRPHLNTTPVVNTMRTSPLEPQ